ncbi:MAG TPA: rhodanese-like domain-containing protein [Anaerolineales bacterium]|nr:rhodanese-like domain-containing protein [Anaerolineales bacterium]
MLRTRTLIAFSILMLVSLACNALVPAASTSTPVVIVEPTFPPQPSDLPATEADVPRVSLEQALTAYSAGAAIFLDVRGAESFASRRIPGAINIPLAEIEANPIIPNVEKDQWIITYCT